MRKLCLSSKFPHQEIRWNYGILRSASYRKTYPRWTQFIQSCLVVKLSLKLGLMFVSFSGSFTALTTWSSQHSLRIYLKGLLIHTFKGCTLDLHPAGTFATAVSPIYITAASLPVKWALNASIIIKDLIKPFSFCSFAEVIQQHFFIPYHYDTFIHPNLLLGDNTEIMKNSKIFDSL